MTAATVINRSAPVTPLPRRALTLLLLGGSLRSANRGVAALGAACLDQLTAAFPDVRIIAGVSGVQEHCELELPDRILRYEACWIHYSSSLRLRSSTRHLQLLHRVRRLAPGLGTRWLANRSLRQLMECDAVLDIGGGDSFADTYTPRVFADQVAVKRLALAMGKPLVLLPQTYGPFRSEETRRQVRQIIQRSALIATRDAFGLQELKSLMGGTLDERFVLCPDVAFTLRPMPVAGDAVPLPPGDGPLIGLNVSGLLWDSNVDFALRADYRELTRQLIAWAMGKAGVRLLLVPHVFNQRMHRPAGVPSGLCEDSDLAVCQELCAEAQHRWGTRVAAIGQPHTAPELKALIGRCDFFVGARMHACIASVSQAIPTMTLAYSKKAAGVMGLAGVKDLVVDLREQDMPSVLATTDAAFGRRQALHERLAATLPAVRAAVRSFFTDRLHTFLSAQALRSMPRI